MAPHCEIVFPELKGIAIGGIEGDLIRVQLAQYTAISSVSVSYNDFDGIVSCLKIGAEALLREGNSNLRDGFHLLNSGGGDGNGLSIIVNEVQLKNIIQLYQNLGSGNFTRVIMYFFNLDWVSPSPKVIGINISTPRS